MEDAADSGIVLRAARPEECAELGELCLRSKAWWGYDEAFIAACREELAIRADDVGPMLCVAEAAGRPAGVAQLSSDGGDWHVDKLFVDPPFIGRGVGAALMRWATETARAMGAVRLVIEADPDAAGFYRRHGAVDAGTVASGSIPGRRIPRLVLALDDGS
jgi:GNAT superfamily N-acetyltransferase